MSQANTTFDFTDCSVLITGGSSGIGLAIAQAFVKAGASVVITGTKAQTADYALDLSAFGYRQLNVEDKQQIKDVAASLDKLDILINNAGASFPDGKDEWDPEIFDRALHINLSSAFSMAHACKDKLSASQIAGGASIINMASLTSFMAVEMVPGYGAAKAGLVQTTKTLGLGWAKNNIRVNAIAPGLIETKMTAGFADNADMNKPILARTPLKRTGKPNDIADVALFLCSSSAQFIVGQTLAVDGGYSVVG